MVRWHRREHSLGVGGGALSTQRGRREGATQILIRDPARSLYLNVKQLVDDGVLQP